jgi:8-oxo-dGTP pyrophosphatase MutT (NUDIX family)
MTAVSLHERLSALYRAGMARDLPKLHLDPRVSPDAPMKPAAVLVAMTECAAPEVLFIRRPASMRAHPARSPSRRAAGTGRGCHRRRLREAQEELGLAPDDVRDRPARSLPHRHGV